MQTLRDVAQKWQSTPRQAGAAANPSEAGTPSLHVLCESERHSARRTSSVDKTPTADTHPTNAPMARYSISSDHGPSSPFHRIREWLSQGERFCFAIQVSLTPSHEARLSVLLRLTLLPTLTITGEGVFEFTAVTIVAA